jgi:Leucyl-tRNA synthetase
VVRINGIPSHLVDANNPVDPQTGEPLQRLYATMSKSKGNGVAPEDVLINMALIRRECSFYLKHLQKKI